MTEKAKRGEMVISSNPEAEKAVLGSVLLNPDCVLQAQSLFLKPTDFSLNSHQVIYRVMQAMSDAGKPIDTVTLGTALEVALPNGVAVVGGWAYIAGLTDGLPRRDNIEHYVKIVKDVSKRRTLINLLNRGLEMAEDPSEATNWIIGGINEDLLKAMAEGGAELGKHVSEFYDEAIAKLHSLRVRGEELIGLTTGIGELDKSTTGLRNGEFIVVGGFPGSGKTSVAVKMAVANAARGHGVLFFSQEMTKEALLNRALSYVTDVAAIRFRVPALLSPIDLTRIAQYRDVVIKFPLWVDDHGSMTVSDVVSRGRLFVKQHKVELIIVDYLQLMQGFPGEKRAEVIGGAANGLRQLAKDCNIPVVALSQLTRPGDKDVNTKPNRFMLKESSDIEAHAHVILLPYHPMDKDTDEPTGEDEIIVAKQREGPMGPVPVKYDLRTLVYMDRGFSRDSADVQPSLLPDPPQEQIQ